MLDVSFNNKLDMGPETKRFRGHIRRVAEGRFEYDEQLTGGRLVSVGRMTDINDALEQLSGMFTDSKYYRGLVAELSGIPASEVFTLKGVTLTTWKGVQHALSRVRPQVDESWRSLSFWDDFINETLKLVTRTLGLSIEVHYHNPTRLRAMFAHLAWLTVVGVALPLLALALPVGDSKRGLSMVGVGGLLGVLLSSLWLLYGWITERRLHDEGKLEL
jgi:hypothetical protein